MSEQTSIQESSQKSAQAGPKTINIYSFLDPLNKIEFPITMGNCSHVDSFQKLNRIGEGTYGIVYRARHRTTNQIVALKRIRMEFTNEGLPISSLREIALLKGLKHENIVSVFDVVVGNGIEDIFMLMEYCEQVHAFNTWIWPI